MARVRVGCTGWGYDDWVGPFYAPGTPPSEWLARYARVFDAVEVDSTYYRIPSRDTVARWASETPASFAFTAKMPGDVTQAGLVGVEGKTDAFLDALGPLREKGKLACVLLQMPASFRRERSAEAFDAFLARWPRSIRLAVELRHASWWTAETFESLSRAKAALAWNVWWPDGKEPVDHGLFAPPTVTSDFLYARFVGDRALTRFDRLQRDLTPALEAMRERFEAETARVADVMAFVNNHFMGFAPATARRLQERLGEPPADLALAARGRGQRGLGDFG